jgi:HK97 family phage major capsid protein
MNTTWLGSARGIAWHHPDMYTIHRAMVGFSGGTQGAYLIKPGWTDFILDKVREEDGPFAHCQFEFSPTREFNVLTYFETSRVDGQRWGGLQARWRGEGASEIESWSTMASNASLGVIELQMKRLMLYFGPISRAALADVENFERKFAEAIVREFRYNIEASMLTGKGMSDMLGIISSPACVVVPKDGGQAAGSISTTNIMNMWASLYGAAHSRDSVYWHANSGTMTALDKLASTFNWPDLIYIPAGKYGNKRAQIRGKPLVLMESLPQIGQPGDLVLCDWGEYVVGMRPMLNSGPLAPMEVAIGLRPSLIEAGMSDQFLFDTDQVAFRFKLRGDGKLTWPKQLTLADGSTVGPAAIIAQR